MERHHMDPSDADARCRLRQRHRGARHQAGRCRPRPRRRSRHPDLGMEQWLGEEEPRHVAFEPYDDGRRVGARDPRYGNATVLLGLYKDNKEDGGEKRVQLFHYNAYNELDEEIDLLLTRTRY